MTTSEPNTHDRRSFLQASGALGAAGVLGGLAGCSGGGGGSGGSSTVKQKDPSKDDPLTVAVYGGTFKDVLDKQLFEPFRNETGIPVESKAEETSSAALSKLKAASNAGKAPVDLSIIKVTGILKGENVGIWHHWSPDEFDNVSKIADNLKHTDEDGNLVGIGALSWFINLVNNTNQMDSPPTSWKALWDDQYKNQLGLLSLASNSYLLDVTAEVYFDGKSTLQTKDGIKKVLQKLEGIKPQAGMWYKDEAQFEQKLKTGDVPAGMLYNDVTLVMEDKGAPVNSHFVDEGSIIDHGEWCTLNTSPHLDAAKTFIDYASKPEVQDRIAKNLYDPPVVKKKYSDLSDDTYKKIAGPGPQAAITPNYQMYIDRSSWISEQWKQLIIG
ncbi:hypothetical protein MBEHAL_0593 [Halarchaeum acidiphilum MH1-52-1]|uniref:ABC transporter, periplasmic spermidine putrescine-binding protein PotD n=1 Tax=Halarchaeum acidiphilum MH1-52-1 TaxID=1261545 RepID=U3AAS0_9EURY|nr:substrate-binding domain-containing protein [Halarchaeum acidiphilum]GAD51833.1 hypothetical protein MBEHAL_0593 [Halarchaeum acidiphilum MH1-52-1]